MPANISGLVSGFKSGELIDAILKQKSIPIQLLQQKKSGYETKISKLADLTSKLNELKTVMESLETQNDVLALTATSDDTTVVEASATAEAVQSTYDLDVTQLAVAEKDQSSEFGDPTDAVAEGSLSISVDGGAATVITIDAGDTLEDVRDAINDANLGVDATIIFDGVDGYTLQVSRQDTGFSTAAASDALVIVESYVGGGQQLGFTEAVQAQNALFTVDGISAQSTSNTVTDVIEGVTLELEDVGIATVTVGKDKETTKENIQAFVDAYNSVYSFVQDEYETTETSDKKKDLSGDTILFKIKSTLQYIAGNDVLGLTGDYTSLSAIGIRTQEDGTLAIDEDDLDAALDDDIDAVGEIFTTDTFGISDALVTQIEFFTDSTDGLLALRDESYDAQIDRIEDRITTLEDRLTALNDRLVRQFTAMETAIAGFQQQGGSLTSLLFGGQ